MTATPTATPTPTFTESLRALLDVRIAATRAEGWEGDDDDWIAGPACLNWVVSRVGRAPSRAEWREAGLGWVGEAHLGPGQLDHAAVAAELVEAGWPPADLVDPDAGWWLAYPHGTGTAPVAGVATDDSCANLDGPPTWYVVDGDAERDNDYRARSLAEALIEAERRNAATVYHLAGVSSTGTVLSDDGEGEVEVFAAEVTIGWPGHTAHGTVTDRARAQSLDEWVGGAALPLARREPAIVRALAEIYLQLAQGQARVTLRVEVDGER